eukprot:76297_1
MMQALNLVDGLITKINAVEDDEKTGADDDELTLAYWNIRGLCDFLRLMLYYKNIKFNNKVYVGQDDWQKDKYNIGLDFPNIPYLIDKKNDVMMTESYAIGKYLAKKYKIGYSANENFKELEIEGVIHDILITFFRLCYNTDFEKEKIVYLKSLIDEKEKLYHIDKYLEKRTYLVNDKELSFIDFKFFSFLDYNVRMDKGFLDKLKNVNKYYQAINSMDFVKRFQDAGLRNLAIVAPSGVFGGKPV